MQPLQDCHITLSSDKIKGNTKEIGYMNLVTISSDFQSKLICHR